MTAEKLDLSLAKKLYDKYIRSHAFDAVRQAVLSRDGHRCRVCGRTSEEAQLNVHHCCYEHLGLSNQDEIDDCITLCQTDHLCIHRNYANLNRFKFKPDEVAVTVPRLTALLEQEAAQRKRNKNKKS